MLSGRAAEITVEFYRSKVSKEESQLTTIFIFAACKCCNKGGTFTLIHCTVIHCIHNVRQAPVGAVGRTLGVTLGSGTVCLVASYSCWESLVS